MSIRYWYDQFCLRRLSKFYWSRQYEELRWRHENLRQSYAALQSLKWTPAPDEARWQYRFVQLEKDYLALEQEWYKDKSDAALWRALVKTFRNAPGLPR